MEFVNNRLTRILVAGEIVNFHFENTKKIGQVLEDSHNKEKNSVKVHENLGSTNASKDKVEEKITKLEVGTGDKNDVEDSENNKMITTTSNSSDSGSFTEMQDVITRNVTNNNCLVEKKPEQVAGDVVPDGPKGLSTQIPRQVHCDQPRYTPPPLRNNEKKTTVRKPNVREVENKSNKDISTKIVKTKKENGPEVSSVDELKLMLERELPIAQEMVDRPKGDGEENVTSPVLNSGCGTSKVDDWLARNEASRQMEELENPVFEPIPNVGEREISITKDDHRKTTSVEKMSMEDAQSEFAKLMKCGLSPFSDDE